MAKFIKGEFVLIPNREQALKLRGASLNVYLAICAHADKDGQCYPSKSTIEEVTGYSRTLVKTALRDLVSQGLLNIESRQRSNGSDSSNSYQIMIVSGGGGRYAAPSGVVDSPPITKPINVPKGTAAKNDEELLNIVNTIAKRSFRVLPRGTKKLLDTFCLVEIEAALRALARDEWHREKLKELSIDYLLRPTTIDKFMGKSHPITDLVARQQRERRSDARMQAFREDQDMEKWDKEHPLNDF